MRTPRAGVSGGDIQEASANHGVVFFMPGSHSTFTFSALVLVAYHQAIIYIWGRQHE
jgi:hypothetical protein